MVLAPLPSHPSALSPCLVVYKKVQFSTVLKVVQLMCWRP